MPTFPDPGSLDEFALRTGADIRGPLLWTLVELYLQKPTHTAEENRHFTELMLRLLEQTDASTRAAIARRLAPCPTVPALIMQRLTGDTAVSAALISRANPASDIIGEARRLNAPVAMTELSELFFSAHSAERKLILLNLGYGTRTAKFAISGDVRAAARELEAAALARKPDAFTRAIERWLGVTPALARRIVTDPLGEPIVVAAKAIGIAPDAAQRMLLFVNPVVGRSISRVYDLSALFDLMEANAAHTLVGIWRAADPPRASAPTPRPAHTDPTDLRIRRRAGNTAAAKQRQVRPSAHRIGGAKT